MGWMLPVYPNRSLLISPNSNECAKIWAQLAVVDFILIVGFQHPFDYQPMLRFFGEVREHVLLERRQIAINFRRVVV